MQVNFENPRRLWTGAGAAQQCDQCALGSVTCALSNAPLSFGMSAGVAPQMFPPEMLDRLRKSHVSEQVHLQGSGVNFCTQSACCCVCVCGCVCDQVNASVSVRGRGATHSQPPYLKFSAWARQPPPTVWRFSVRLLKCMWSSFDQSRLAKAWPPPKVLLHTVDLPSW